MLLTPYRLPPAFMAKRAARGSRAFTSRTPRGLPPPEPRTRSSCNAQPKLADNPGTSPPGRRVPQFTLTLVALASPAQHITGPDQVINSADQDHLPKEPQVTNLAEAPARDAYEIGDAIPIIAKYVGTAGR